MTVPNISNIPVLFSEQAIRDRVQTMADEISKKVPRDVMIVALLRGSFVFVADLIRALHLKGINPQIDFMTLSSYGTATESSRTITINRDISEEVTNRHVLIVDDILESGRTLTFARNLIQQRGATNVSIAVFLHKPGKLETPINADFVGFTVPDKFVVGYGLDYANYFRELPYIGTVDVH